MNKKAVALLRVSSHGQQDNTSRTTQERDVLYYCKKNDLELVDMIPIVETARKSELRKKYSEAIDRALTEKIHHLVFHKYDREARNLTDNERNENLVRDGRITLHYVVDQRVLRKDSPDTDFLMRDYHAVQNKHYSRDLSTKVRAATKTKAELGWFPGNHPPLGYINERIKGQSGREFRRGTIIVRDLNERKIAHVRREFELRASKPTPSLGQIRKQIIEEGLVLPSEANNYHVGPLEKRLKNIFYNGRFIWQGVEYDGKHERIISAEMFWLVQETFGIKGSYRANQAALFGNGWLKCADPECGCSIVYDPMPKVLKTTGETKMFKYYHCTNGKRIHANLKGMRISEEEVMRQCGQAVSKISITEDFQDQLVEALNETKAKARKAIKRDIENYKAALIALKGKEDRAYDNFDSDHIDRDTYNRQRKRLQEEQRTYTELMEKAQLQINDVTFETVKSILQLATNAESLWNRRSPAERRAMLDKLLSNRVLDGVTVRYEIIKPLQTLSEMKGDANWRAQQDKFLTECLAWAA